MGSPAAKRRFIIYCTLIGCGLAVCGWQAQEHVRFRRNAEQALINRGRDITSTLGVLLRSQRRQFGIISKERLESALEDLVSPEEIESVAILGGTGTSIASAGNKMELTPEMLQAKGVFWRGDTVTILNFADLDAPLSEDGARNRPPIVVSDEAARAFRQPVNRRLNEGRATNPGSTTAPAPGSSPSSSTGTPSAGGTLTGTPATSPSISPPTTPAAAATAAAPAQPGARFAFGRPPWITPEDFSALIQRQGVRGLVLSLSTADMRRKVQADLLLRSMVSLLAMGGAIISVLAWRNVGKNSELQIRLVKAGEMNTHLKEMNLAAAGLAHETRNPLNLIRGLAQMIAMEAQAAPKLREHASTIIEEADRVTVQLNEFIDYSKPREAHFGPVDVSRLVADVARTLLPDIEDKHIRLQPPTAPLVVEADEQLFRQALFNLLLNAVQAVDAHGTIEIRHQAAVDGAVTLEILDDGPGVPEAERANIFKPYVTMRPKGVGLGLAIVQQIIAAHRWEIACLTNTPRGAVFRLSHLKLATPAA